MFECEFQIVIHPQPAPHAGAGGGCCAYFTIELLERFLLDPQLNISHPEVQQTLHPLRGIHTGVEANLFLAGKERPWALD
jgi:hypothetical protein